MDGLYSMAGLIAVDSCGDVERCLQSLTVNEAGGIGLSSLVVGLGTLLGDRICGKSHIGVFGPMRLKRFHREVLQ